MILPMMSTRRRQQRYDHRLRDLVQRTGDVTITTDLEVPRSTGRGWLRKAPTVVVSLELTNLKIFSLRIVAWRVADTFAPVNSVAVLVEASRAATPSATTPIVLADAGVE